MLPLHQATNTTQMGMPVQPGSPAQRIQIMVTATVQLRQTPEIRAGHALVPRGERV